MRVRCSVGDFLGTCHVCVVAAAAVRKKTDAFRPLVIVGGDFLCS